ncbi:MAG TPA: response regulator transcription factor [Bryobacteraceae bacterium]|nr:response regulator transcription factor [Bryobacteraceae bacterium]
MSESLDTVAVCATEPIAIEGLRSLLESAEGLRVVATETTLPDGIDAVRELRPAILLVDKAFGTHAVMDCPGALRKADCATAVVVWGATFPEAEALRFVQAGAAGVLRKTARLDVLLACLRAVARGATWMEDAVRDPERSVLRGHSHLTARELQVMELVERGMKNRDIGEALGIRTGTVKIHLKHIFEKTGIRGRYGLALSGLKEKGWLVPAMLEM